MPRSMQQIINQAEDLAKRFEDYEPSRDDQRPAESLVHIRAAVIARAEAERSVAESVRRARKDGLSWAAIGGVLGTSGEAARQRYSATVDN